MGWTWTPYTVPLLATALLSAALAAYGGVSARRRGEAVYAAFAVLMAATAWWAVALSVRLSVTGLGAKVTAAKLNVAPGLVAVAWFAFAAVYTGHDEWTTPRRLAILASEPLVYGLVGLPTNGVLHRLIVVEARLEPAAVGDFSVLVETPGPWFYLDAAWSYALVVGGIYLLGRLVIGSRRVYRGQAAAMLVGVAVPLAVNAAHRARLTPDPHVNPTPLAFALSGVALWVGVFRYSLLDLVPVARDSVIENMRDGYVVLDDRDRVVDHNPAAARLLGVEAVGIGRPAGEILPAEVVERLPSPDGDPVETEVVVEERRLGGPAGEDAPDGVGGGGGRRNGDGGDAPGEGGSAPGDGDDGSFAPAEGTDERYVSVTVSGLSDDDRFIGRLVTLRDVTERRAVERRYGALIEHSSDLITVLDGDGVVTYQSPSVERVLGIPPESLEGATPFEHVHPEDHDRLEALLDDGLGEADRSERFEFRVRDAEGEWRVFEGVARDLLDNPFVEGTVVNSRDVTERRRRERELRRRNERLEEFASVVSHDLRNPLNVARIHAENAYDDPEAHVPELEAALDRMERMIRDILALARQGETVGEADRLDLEAVAREAWSNVDTRGASLVVADTRELAADEDRLLTLFENLFGNSVEHGSTGNRPSAGDAVEHGSTGNRPSADHADEHAGPAVTVRVEATAEGFAVADDGPGIPPEERERVFESGYTTAEDGTGFGLAIVRRIARAHGWEVSVDESEEGGARFVVDASSTDAAVESGRGVADD